MLATIKNKLKKSNAVIHAFRSVFTSISWLPKKKRLIFFESFNGRQYSDSPRAIYEYMQEHYPEYRCVWSVDKRSVKIFEEQGIDYARKFSFKWLWLYPRAAYWVTNSRLPLWFKKTSRTTYLQTWHGTPLKRLGIDIPEVHMPEITTEEYQKGFLYESSKWDYLVSPNRYSSDIFKRAFKFNQTMIESGYPRNDYLVRYNTTEKRQEIKNKMGLPTDKKIILYAPTWRDDTFYDKGRYKFDIQLDLARLQEVYGNDAIILLRMHYLVAENLKLDAFEGFVYDYSSYEDIRDLYVVSDVLMTDYSSVFFDYAITGKPILFYVYDIEHYRNTLRGFYLDFEKMAPGPLLKTTEEVIQALQDIDLNGFTKSQNYIDVQQTYTSLEDGHATKRVVESVFGLPKKH